MWRDDAYILDIVLNARAAIEHVGGLTEGQFVEDSTVHGATMYRLMLLGEAANRVSQEWQGAHSDVPWRRMIGLRNRLIHDYRETQLDLAWRIVREDLPAVIDALEPFAPSADYNSVPDEWESV